MLSRHGPMIYLNIVTYIRPEGKHKTREEGEREREREARISVDRRASDSDIGDDVGPSRN